MAENEERSWSLLKRNWVIISYWLVNRSKWFLYRVVRPKARVALTLLYLLGVTAVGLGAAILVDSRPLTDGDSALFSTIGAMLAGMLAIVFALRALLIQNAAATQSSGLFDIVARDRWQNTAYWLIALFSLYHISIAAVLAVSPGTLSFMTSSVAVGVVIIASGVSLYLVSFGLFRLHRQVNPLHSINHVKSTLLRLMSKAGEDAKRHANYMQAKSPQGKAISDAERLAVAFSLMKGRIAELSTFLTFLFDYHDKLYQQRENTAAHTVLRAIKEIAIKYVEVRRSSFFLVQSSEPWVAVSDSQRFFRDLLEPLVSKAKQYMQSGDDFGVIEVIDIIERLTAKATEVKFIGNSRGENPLVEQCRGHLGQIIRYAGGHQNTEGLYQGAKSLGRIGKLTAGASLELEAVAISTDLTVAVSSGLFLRQELVWCEALNSLCMLLEAYGTNRTSRHTASVTFILNNLCFTLNAVFAGIGRSFVGVSNRGYRAFALPFDVATGVIYSLVEKADRGADKQDVSPSLIVKTCEEYGRFLRKLSEEVKSADSYMVETAAKSISQISMLLLSKQSSAAFDGYQDDLQNELNGFVYQLGRFADDAAEIEDEHHFDALVESATVIGLQAVGTGHAEIATSTIRVIQGLAKAYAEKAQEPYYGITVPRIVERACYVGIFAVQEGQGEVVDVLKEVVADTDAQAKKQAGESAAASSDIKKVRINLVEDEVGRLHDECMDKKYNPISLDESSQRKLFAKIECHAIDDFCEEVWGFKASERYRSSSIP